jgi:hypothetical protein
MAFDRTGWLKNNATPWYTAEWIKAVYDAAMRAYRAGEIPDELNALQAACRDAEKEDPCSL